MCHRKHNRRGKRSGKKVKSSEKRKEEWVAFDSLLDTIEWDCEHLRIDTLLRNLERAISDEFEYNMVLITNTPKTATRCYGGHNVVQHACCMKQNALVSIWIFFRRQNSLTKQLHGASCSYYFMLFQTVLHLFWTQMYFLNFNQNLSNMQDTGCTVFTAIYDLPLSGT